MIIVGFSHLLLSNFKLKWNKNLTSCILGTLMVKLKSFQIILFVPLKLISTSLIASRCSLLLIFYQALFYSSKILLKEAMLQSS